MMHAEEIALVIIGAAEEAAEATDVPKPWIWYGSHMIGQRMVIVVSAEEMGSFPTWPGDIITESTSEALEWLTREPEQHLLGIPPVWEKPPEKPREEPEPERAAISLIVTIRWWVDYFRSNLDKDPLVELFRSPDHSYVEVGSRHPLRASPYIDGGWNMCRCGRIVQGDIDGETCPLDIGCNREVES